MTATANPLSAPSDRQPGALAGTGTLLRFMLRRDRIRLPAWVLGVTALMAYFANAIGAVMDAEGLESLAAMLANPVMALIGGPGYGFDDITVPRVLAGMYGLYIMLGAALMSILTVARHTRVEEQTGRAELVRANAAGRHAQLAAALIVAVLMSLLVSLLTSVVVAGAAIDPRPDVAGSVLLGFSFGAVGLVFAGVAAVTAQLSSFSRACSGLAGVVLGAAFVLRGLGDMSKVQDGGLSGLSWLSPLGWSQQTAPFTLDRWWPLLLSVAGFVVLVAVAFRLESRRDLAGGIFADRLGSAHAAVWLRSSFGLAFRLQRPSLIGWSAAILVAGLIFGAFTQSMNEGIGGMPEEIVRVMGGADGIVEGYLGFMGLYFAVIIAVYAILSVQSLRAEEQGFRAEPVLAASVGRPAWLLWWVTVTALGALWLLALAGLGEGIGAAVTVGDASLIGPTLLGHAVHVGAAWFLLGLATALYGLAPRLLGLTWAVFGYGAVLSLFGEMLEFGQRLLDTSPFQHAGQYPAGVVSWGGVGVLVVLAVVLAGVGTLAFGRRDLTTA
ncbi:ABC transporter permease [Aeromicrobium sp. PE09-221]|uniref:ABC transporter permease n=1 Tax=Aeromicrobium sp. PE09-221 TaxID=1898043 RepID=UPI000B3E6A7D|nr:ABC transporter permease [Aeromicrobium sp. PE09-221]OUZ06464.1 ABC transporter permease [Aeromicrobium sp. PE09-221]